MYSSFVCERAFFVSMTICRDSILNVVTTTSRIKNGYREGYLRLIGVIIGRSGEGGGQARAAVSGST